MSDSVIAVEYIMRPRKIAVKGFSLSMYGCDTLRYKACRDVIDLGERAAVVDYMQEHGLSIGWGWARYKLPDNLGGLIVYAPVKRLCSADIEPDVYMAVGR